MAINISKHKKNLEAIFSTFVHNALALLSISSIVIDYFLVDRMSDAKLLHMYCTLCFICFVSACHTNTNLRAHALGEESTKTKIYESKSWES